MNRQQRRAAERHDQKPGLTIAEAQFQARVRRAVDSELKKRQEEGINEAVNTAMLLLLTFPLEVLMDHYWQDCYEERIPEFTNYVLEYYRMWQNDELDMEKLKEDLWEYGHVRLEAD